MFVTHPLLTGKLLANIPRIENIAKIIENQNTPPDASNTELQDIVIIGAQILHVALDLDRMLVAGISFQDALVSLKKRKIFPST